MEAIGALVLIILVIIAIGLALGVLWCGAVGAMHQFAWASEMGFVGVVIFFAAWIFMFPIMAIWAVIWGFTVIKN
ncbi:hypothetical protein OAO50_05790 [Paracoccaceae bacterium]|nr:hypothetical protein [Paracoccaceae bacterium]